MVEGRIGKMTTTRVHLANKAGRILLVSMEFAGLRGKGVVGNMVKDAMTFLRRRGVETTAVIPSSNLEKFDAVHHKGFFQGKVDGLDVVAVESKLGVLYPTGDQGHEMIVDFSNNLWSLVEAMSWAKRESCRVMIGLAV